MKELANRILGAALSAWLLALVGCGTMTRATAPATDDASNSTMPAASQPARTAEREGMAAGPQEPIRHPSPQVIENGVKVQKPVQGEVGGTLALGSVQITVPPDAFDGTATISLVVPDPNRLECHLDINPPSMNRFDVPVRLEFDVRTQGNLRFLSVYWYDESCECWVPVTTTIDPVTRKVWADLPHFSIYKVVSEVQTRAGW
jgi:hypothetical protein